MMSEWMENFMYRPISLYLGIVRDVYFHLNP